MADNDASVVRRATLSTLPLEIKGRICELAALQDERYKERWFDGAPGEDLVKVHKNEWRGRSLAALSETSKEFNQLAATHIFHTLTDTQIDSFKFSMIVLPKHTSRVRCVIIDHGPQDPAAVDVRRTFVALPLLPNLSDLQITHDAVFEVLGDLTQEPEDEQARMFRDAFRPVARRLRTVALDDFRSTDDVVAFLSMCDNVQDLEVHGPAVAEERLGEHLSTIATLERLTLDATCVGNLGLHLPGRWPALPTLSSLTLINIELDASSVALIDRHSASLHHLTLRLPKKSPPTLPSGFPTFTKLPLLSTFSLRNVSSSAFEAIVAAVALATTALPPSTNSHLSHLHIALKDRGKSLDHDRLQGSLHPFKHLQFLCITTPDYFPLLPAIAVVLDPLREGGILSPMSSRRDPFLLRTKPAAYRSVEGDDLRRRQSIEARHLAISGALVYGQNLLNSYVRDGDLEGLEIMMGSVGQIWGHKMLQDG